MSLHILKEFQAYMVEVKTKLSAEHSPEMTDFLAKIHAVEEAIPSLGVELAVSGTNLSIDAAASAGVPLAGIVKTLEAPVIDPLIRSFAMGVASVIFKTSASTPSYQNPSA